MGQAQEWYYGWKWNITTTIMKAERYSSFSRALERWWRSFSVLPTLKKILCTKLFELFALSHSKKEVLNAYSTTKQDKKVITWRWRWYKQKKKIFWYKFWLTSWHHKIMRQPMLKASKQTASNYSQHCWSLYGGFQVTSDFMA